MRSYGKLMIIVSMMLILGTALLPMKAHAYPGDCKHCGVNDWLYEEEREATCTSPGRTVYVCGNCGASVEETSPALGHSWDLGEVTKEPGCTMPGTRVHECNLCGETMSESIPALGHAWDSGKVTAEARCDTPGVRTYTCGNCGETRTESIPALGHSWDGGKVTAEAGCDTPGTRSYTCTTCGSTRTETIPAVGHSWDQGVVTREARCGTEGVRTYTCSRCKETRTEAIPALAHDWDEGVTDPPKGLQDGRTVYTCRNCGATREEAVPVLAMTSGFFASLRNMPPDGEESGLRVTRQPEGAHIIRGSGEVVTISLEVEGGTEPYTYHWYAKSFEEKEPSTIYSATAGKAVQGLGEKYKNFASDWYGAHKETFGGIINSEWSQMLDSGTLLEDLGLVDMAGTFPNEPVIEVTEGNCDYWCEIEDADGNRVMSEGARVIYKLRIAQQPRSINWQSEAGEEEVVYLTCQAADGSGKYSYQWFRNGDFSMPYGIYDECPVMDLGEFVCQVTDLEIGELVMSDTVVVYDLPSLEITEITEDAALWPEEEWELKVKVQGGEAPYEVWWEKEGLPLLTVKEDGDEPVFVATGVGGGAYTVHVTDSMGESITETVIRTDRELTITSEPSDTELNDEGYAKLSVQVTDGEAPYTYSLYHDGKRGRTKRGDDKSSHDFYVYDTGEYYIQVRDSLGHSVKTRFVNVTMAELRIESQTLEAELDGEVGYLSVVVSGGKKPYTYQWMVDRGDGWYTLGEDSNMLPVSLPGEYLCKIRDAEGRVIRSKRIPANYVASAPMIIVQPEGGSKDRDDTFRLSCKAIGSHGDKNLVYLWQKNAKMQGTGGWYRWSYSRTLDADEPGVYRCKVTDKVTGESTFSNIVTVSNNIRMVMVYDTRFENGVKDYTVVYHGGRGPSTLRLYSTQESYTLFADGTEKTEKKDILMKSVVSHSFKDTQTFVICAMPTQYIKQMYLYHDGVDEPRVYTKSVDSVFFAAIHDGTHRLIFLDPFQPGTYEDLQ